MNIFNLVNKFTLSFKDPFLENHYKQYFYNRFSFQIKIAMVFAIFLYIFFGILDIILYPEIKDELLGIRLKFVVPFLICLLAILFMNNNLHEYIHTVLTAGSIIGGVGIIEMIRIINSHGYSDNMYFSGLLLVAFFSYTFFRLKFLLATITGIILIGVYEFVFTYLSEIPGEVLSANNFFFITVNIIGMVISYLLELDSRKYFLLYRKLEKEKEDLAEDKIRFEKLAHIDGLTGIYNKRYFMDNLRFQWFKYYKRSKISLLMIDVDYFKLYNDYYGHVEGDKCLIKIAKELKNIIRKSEDIVARFGGEEFVILLPQTDTLLALQVANRAKRKILELKIPHKLSPISPFITVSIGISTMIPKDKNFEEIIKKADKALYLAKKKGRNKICLEGIG